MNIWVYVPERPAPQGCHGITLRRSPPPVTADMNQGLTDAFGEVFHSIIFVGIDMSGTSVNIVLTASVT